MRRFVSIAMLLLVGCARPSIERVEWTVMGTVAAVQWRQDGRDYRPAVAKVKETFERVSSLLNAHDPQSELSRLAHEGDSSVLATCDPFVRPCYAAAFGFRNETGGVFNPRWRGAGTMDLGGIAKGFAVDVAAERLADLPEDAEVLIDLGGNLKAVRGTWSTAVAGPDGVEPKTFDLKPGEACATSAEYYRGHHIRDGRTGGEIRSTVYSVTAVHPRSAMSADALSTILFVLGRKRGEELLKRRHPDVRAVWLGEE